MTLLQCQHDRRSPRARRADEAGFSLPELLISTALMLIVSGVVTSALLQMTKAQSTIWNRTELHSGVRSATELLQQEVGQAGRIALPAAVTVSTTAVSAGATTAVLSSVTGMFVGENLVVDAGSAQETVHISAINTATKTITINNSLDATATSLATSFLYGHSIGASVSVSGGFTTGVIPPAASPVNFSNGSTATVLKLFGDINADGSMVYVEYTCDTAAGNLYRNMVAFDAVSKPTLTAAQVLLSNITANPNSTPCFQYQMDSSNTYVLDVAITMTVNTQKVDPVTKQLQTETKALLNVSPRNVVNTWELAAHNAARVQSTPSTITTLIGL
jgi:prepilin-type N-terminal cleavage/methylation domain-containing protein